MKRKSTNGLALAAIASAAFILLNAGTISAHCQLPCGIYDDDVRFTLMHEQATTIEKAMGEINELSADAGANINQLTRWVNIKDKSADDLSHIISYYFLAQRIKAPADDNPKTRALYLEKLELIHQITVSAMKCKQTTDVKNVDKLHSALEKFQQAYAGR